MSRRNLLLATTLSSGGGVQEPEWPVYLTIGDNGDVGTQLYNYLISILPEDATITLPTTEYKIGDIIVNGYGTATMCRVLGIAKVITIMNDNLMEDGCTPSLYSTGLFV